MPGRYASKDLVAVVVNGNNYVFPTNLPAAARTELGIEPFDPESAPLRSFQGANSPKPKRASKRSVTGFDSGWCDDAKVNDLKGSGWTISRPKLRRVIVAGSPGARAITVSVDIGGIKYAWNMAKELYDKINEEFTGLGIDKPTADDAPTLVWGSEIPKPAKAMKDDPEGEGGMNRYSTFVSKAKEGSLPAGWYLTKPSILFKEAPAAPAP